MRTSLLLINLAVADLLVGAVCIPMYTVFQWPESSLAQNKTFSNAYLYIDLTTGFASLFGLAAIALERVYSVFFPHRHRATGKIPYLVAIVACWHLAGLQMFLRSLNAHQIIVFKVFFYNMVFALSFVLVVICVAYAAVWRKVRVRNFEQSDGRNNRISVEQERKLVQSLAIINGVFVITWLPFYVLNIALFFCSPSQWKVGTGFVYGIKLLHYSNSFMNLVIYSFRFPDFRRTLGAFFGRHRRVRVMKSAQTIGHPISPNARYNSAFNVEGAQVSSL